MSLRLDWCSYEAAKYAVEHWHYSQRIPKSRQVYIGVWESDIYIGAVIFGKSITPYLGDAFGLSHIECAELTRIALNKHINPVSKIATVAIKMLAKQSPGLRLLVSYADPNVGHSGGIYQAMNWVYIGASSKIVQYFWRGQWRNDTPMFNAFKANPELRKSCQSRELIEKHKYLFPLDDAMRKQVEPLRKPYPKRGTGEIDNAPQSNGESGGASPTVPLLSYTEGKL